MAKFEEELKSKSLESLHAMQKELKEKVESGKLSFSKRATNLLKGVLIGFGTLTAFGVGNALSHKRETRRNAHEAFEQWREDHPDQNYFKGFDEFRKANPEAGKVIGGSSTLVMASNITSIGAIIGSTIALNKSSKRKQSEKLGFVEQELARREAVMQGVTEKQR
jgi:hypothetical protein